MRFGTVYGTYRLKILYFGNLMSYLLKLRSIGPLIVNQIFLFEKKASDRNFGDVGQKINIPLYLLWFVMTFSTKSLVTVAVCLKDETSGNSGSHIFITKKGKLEQNWIFNGLCQKTNKVPNLIWKCRETINNCLPYIWMGVFCTSYDDLKIPEYFITLFSSTFFE